MIVNALPEDVTWFTSDQVGAQQMMGGSNGDLLKVLDACLIDGWGLTEAQSVIAENDYVTIVFPTAHGFLQNQMVVIDGAVNPQLNGSHRAKRMTPTTMDIDVSGVIEETGTITVKLKPLGWQSIFGANDPLKRAYRSLSAGGAKRVLYLDMSIAPTSGYHPTTPTNRAMVSVCSDMQVFGEQIGSLTDSINNFSTNPNGSLIWFQKRGSAQNSTVSRTPSRWKVIGNKDFFYLVVGWSAYNATHDNSLLCDVFGFGEFASLSDDQDPTFLMSTYYVNDTGNISTGANGAKMGAYLSTGSTNSMSAYCFNGGVFVENRVSPMPPPSGSVYFYSGGNSVASVFPNKYGETLLTSNCKIYDSSWDCVGILPSLLFVENYLKGARDSSVIDDVLVCQAKAIESPSGNTAGNVGFYIGG